MRPSLYSVAHAMSEQVVVASSVFDGRSACADHTGSVPVQRDGAALEAAELDCRWCRQAPHRAYFVVGRHALCIRHAADAVFPNDDMRAHDMAHAAYVS